MKQPEVFMPASEGLRTIMINGKKYILEKATFKKIDKVEHGDKLVFVPFDKEEYKTNQDKLVEAIMHQVTGEELVRELVKKIDYKTMRRMVKQLDENKPVKKQSGCLGIKIGNVYTQLID